MRRCTRIALLVTMWVGLASAPALATGNRWQDEDSDSSSWQHDDSDSDSDSDHQPTSKGNGGPAVPEPTGALVFAAGLLAVRRATRRR